jgi:hypothetical protein
MPSGLAGDDGAALHFVDGVLHRVVASRPNARAYRVELRGEDVVETAIDADYLGSDGG